MPWTAVMGKYRAGKLKSGSGDKVTSRKQAVAIMLSEKRAAAHKPEYRSRVTQKRGSLLHGKG